MHRGGKYWIVFVLFLIAAEIKAKPNDTLTTAQVESVSLKLYNNKNWKELVRYTDIVIDKGFDYYFIRMRAGIANYEMEKYRKAELHFKKALLYNEGDEDATSYLYYCLIFDEKYEEARWLSKSFRETLAKKIGTSNSPKLTYANIEGAVKLSSNHDSISTANYFEVGLMHYAKNRVSLFHSFSYNSQNEFGNTEVHNDETVHLLPAYPGAPLPESIIKLTDTVKSSITIKQYHYYLKANIPLKNNFLFSMSGQWIYEKDYLKTDDYTINYIQPTTLGPPPVVPPPDTIYAHQVTKNVPGNSNSIPAVSSFIVSSSLKKSFIYIDCSAGALANLNKGHNEYQFSASLEYHPFANNFFNIGCIGYLHWAQSFGATNSISYSPYLSFVPLKKLSITADYLHNTKGNVVEYAGYYVNNTPFFIKDKFSLGANYHFNNKLGVYINYGLENRGSRYSDFTFTNNLFLIGIAITP